MLSQIIIYINISIIKEKEMIYMSKVDNKDRRKNISFKDTMRDKMLLEWALDKADNYGGFSAYMKKLIQDDMERGMENNESSK